jgi:5-methylcytosine-specific restriction protein A
VFSCSESEQKQLNTWVSFQSAEQPLLGQFSVSGNTPAKAQNFVDVPEDDSAPQQGVTVTRYFVRNSKIKGWILENAKGICEACDQPGPFEMDGKPYLEVHHVRHLAQQGKDRKNNTVALCPNCHRRCHHSSDREEFTDSLYKKVKRLKRQ